MRPWSKESQVKRTAGLIACVAVLSLPGVALESDTMITTPVETIKLQNDTCEAEIVTKPFVHLLSFRLLGGKNHLLNFDTPNPYAPGQPKRPLFIVGAKLWYAPEVAGSHEFGLLSGAITQTKNVVEAQLDPDPNSKLQGKVRFELDEHRAQVVIACEIKNVGTVERETSCWWPVSFEVGGRMEAVPIPAHEEPQFTYHYWSYGGTASDPACHIDKDLVTLDLDQPIDPPHFKIGFRAHEILVRKSDCAYRITVLDPPVDDAHRYPHGDSPVLLYRDQKTGFCEAEVSGPLCKLKPGEAARFKFQIALEAAENK